MQTSGSPARSCALFPSFATALSVVAAALAAALVAASSLAAALCAFAAAGAAAALPLAAAAALSGAAALLAPPAALAGGVSDPDASLARASIPLQPLGVPFVDPTFDSTVTRITDATSSGGFGTHIYSQLQAFSADNAYVLLIENDYVVRRMGDLSPVAGLDMSEWNDPRWQPALPHTLVHYDTNADTDVTVSYTDVDTLVSSDVYTFPPQYQRIRSNQSFDELSRDGRWMGGMLARDDGADVMFALDLSSMSLGAVIAIPDLYSGPCRRDPQWGEVPPDWVGVSPLGNYMVVQWERDGTERCSGLETFDIATGAFVGRAYDGHQHGDLGVLPDGATEFFMTFELSSPMDNGRPATAYRVLPGTATASDPVYLQVLDWADSGHLSCQGPNGACVVSWGRWPGDGWTPFEGEVFIQYTDGSVLRLVHHRSSECGYWVQARASMSSDGSRVIFASDWGQQSGGDSCGGGNSLGAGEAYVVDVYTAVCGNNTLDDGEACDDGNLIDGDGCDSNCTGTACGNAIVTAGEECDDGNTAPNDGCDANCMLECGNGAPDGGEQCDDGNLVDGDGCDSNCTFTACGNSIVTDGEDCDDGNANAGDCCDGTCAFEASGAACGDGDVCNGYESCDGTGVCTAGAALDCDDGDLCTQDSCDAVAGCANLDEPANGCFAAERSNFDMSDKAGGSRDQLKWKFKRGDAVEAADLGDPSGTTGYALCLWDSSGGVPARVAKLELPANADWKLKSSGDAKYRDSARPYDGIGELTLKTGGSGRSKAMLKAAGDELVLPSPAGADYFFTLDTELTVQLVNSEGACWSSSFTEAKRNSASQFKAKTP